MRYYMTEKMSMPVVECRLQVLILLVCVLMMSRVRIYLMFLWYALRCYFNLWLAYKCHMFEMRYSAFFVR